MTPPTASRIVPGKRVRINPENPSTVPEKYRDRMQALAYRMYPPEHDDMRAGVLQMLTDLLALSLNDGCIAAAWAFEQLAPIDDEPEAKQPHETIEGQIEIIKNAVDPTYAGPLKPGDEVWVRAKVLKLEYDKCTVRVDAINDLDKRVYYSVPLSDLRKA